MYLGKEKLCNCIQRLEFLIFPGPESYQCVVIWAHSGTI
jgi:hypothetical protein